jgi:ribosome-associated toxin RatA of RatAB toxin-antitoxin module
MPKVTIELPIPAPVDEVWEILLDVDDYSNAIEHVRSVEVLEAVDDRMRRVAWSVLLKGSVLEWVEEETVDPGGYSIAFEQLSGDLEFFNGRWYLEPDGPGATKACFEVEFEIGIPPLAEMLNPVAQRALHESSIEVLRGIEKKCAVA